MIEPDIDTRAGWLGLLALTAQAPLLALAEPRLIDEPYTLLRGPETGLVMANARIDGAGNRFNLAEVPVSRCTVRSARGPAGVGYRMGRCPQAVLCIARLDALLQSPEHAPRLREELLAPLLARLRAGWLREDALSASSRVRFDTLTPETLS
ncbi:MAG: phosphonate C-P lyase system protein PhnG [Burkholderiaceae bacterium]